MIEELKYEQNRKDLEKEQLRVVEMQLKREKERNIESFKIPDTLNKSSGGGLSQNQASLVESN